LFKDYHPWNTNPPWPELASSSLLQVLAPPDRAKSQWEILIQAARPGSNDLHGSAPPDDLLHRMFDPVSRSNDPHSGGLGMSPSVLMRTARHFGWKDPSRPGDDACYWEPPD